MKINKLHIRLLFLTIAIMLSGHAGYAQDGGTEFPEDSPHDNPGNEAGRLNYDVQLSEFYDTLMCLVHISESDSVFVPFTNAGNSTLTSLNYTYELNNQTYGPLSWSGNVETDEVGFLSIPPFINAQAGQIVFSLYTENPNGTADENPSNDSIVVTTTVGVVPQLPFTSIQSQFCANDTALLGSNLPAQYSFYWNQLQDSSRIQQVTSSGTYSVKAYSQDGCTTEAQYLVETLPVPDSKLTNQDTFCLNESPKIEVSSKFTSFSWQGSGTVLNDSTFIPASTGKISLDVIDSNNCSFSFDTLIQVANEPAVSYPGGVNFCSGDLAQISPAIAPGNSPLSFNWNDGNRSLNRMIKSPGVYTVTISNAYGCEKTDTVSIIENPLPVPAIVGPDAFCSGDEIVVASNKMFTRYHWNTGNKNRVQKIKEGGKYILTVTDHNNCVNTAEVVIDEMKPKFDLGSDTILCKGDALLVDLEGAGSVYEWNDGLQNAKRFISESGEYSVTVTDSLCVFTDTFHVDEITKPDVDFGFDVDDFSVHFSNFSINADSFMWTFEPGVFSTGENPSYIYNEIGSYTVKLKGFNACGYESISKNISVGSISVLEHHVLDDFIVFPNPVQTGSALNLKISGFKGSQIQIKIINALGQQMFEERSPVSGRTAEIKLNLKNLSAGNYFLLVSDPDISDKYDVKQFVISK